MIQAGITNVKKILATALIVAFATVMTGCGTNFGTTEDGKQKYRWKFTVTAGANSTWYTAAQLFGEELDKQSNGRMKLQIFTGERLSAGEPVAGVEQLMDGAKDFSYNSPIIYAGINPKFGAVVMPFRFTSVEEGHEALQGSGGEAYRKLLAENGVELLGFGESGMRQVTNSKRPIKTPADMKGLKLRIPGFGLYTDFYRTVGANPTTMPFSEVFTAIQQGAIDGQENPVDVIYSADLQAVQPYLSIWNYSYDPLILGMNKDLYESLSDEDKQIVRTAAQKANTFQINENRKQESIKLQEMEESGIQAYEMTDDEVEQFRASLAPLYDKYRDIYGDELSKEFIPEGEK
ncbi:DctP family TRAP transporter solute-binding subunit [Brevibacterium sp. UMB1308A]|uniref:DctP family TRAP transporter solute-binding subunit n=1 Tax=Brevibacterium sp. UMB1308A TaxID=3050608 RepID=UPI00254DDA58|nr:DctP family TRAP transporter solute-binding subunit [Brevibacterium sp. UMB1308A]MDK8347419.1 DctP family TRAP transporter solute-binding subunit [Brevibacterium sp. UMB1308B]MDK8714328.1 DctP family TRAP transporter solute-binding subunit [Brevibacterium sp. UMB1308A]